MAPPSTTATPLIGSPRGQLTLPKAMRACLCLWAGSVVVLREEEGRLLLDPAAATPVAHDSDEEIQRLVASCERNGRLSVGAGVCGKAARAAARVADHRVSSMPKSCSLRRARSYPSEVGVKPTRRRSFRAGGDG